MSAVLYEVADRVCTITIDRPEVRNALSPAALEELRGAFERAGADADVGVVILTGAGDRAFSAGADLSGGGSGTFADPRSYAAHEERGGVPALLRAIHACPRPVVAKVRGYCLAGGFGVALACDLLIASETAVFGTPEIRVGLFPMVIFAEIVRNVGMKATMELVLTGKRIDAARGERLGFVNAVVPEERLDAEVAELAGALARLSPVVLGLGKRACRAAADMTYDQALDFLRAELAVNLLTEDSAEGLRAFREKRDPDFTGR